jgi:UDP-glucose 4-epimerase
LITDSMKLIVTGGAGFIGSHLADKLVEAGSEVTVIDNLSSGKKDYLNAEASFVKKDIRTDLVKEFSGADTVFHFAADPDVRASALNPVPSYDINVFGTFNVLEACRKAGVKRIVFPSTSTVYGETDVIPTPETAPAAPISNYGASKVACEAYLSSYASTYGLKATVLRFANIVGERSTHGVMFDFYNKLKKNPKEMEILGDGNQDKSYLHVSDCVDAVIYAWERQKKVYDVFNVGSLEKHTVNELAQAMFDSLDLRPKIRYTGTPHGWVGDLKVMLLDTTKLRSLDWKQRVGFEEGVRRYCEWMKTTKV